jgi:transcriptional regulator with XRE-family HTH domain
MRHEDSSHQSLGEYLREAREQAGLSIRELARLAEVNHAFLARVESGERGASAELLQRLADVLDVDAAELLAYVGIRPALPEPRMYFRSKLGVDADEAEILARLIEDHQAKKRKEESTDENTN